MVKIQSGTDVIVTACWTLNSCITYHLSIDLTILFWILFFPARSFAKNVFMFSTQCSVLKKATLSMPPDDTTHYSNYTCLALNGDHPKVLNLGQMSILVLHW